MSEREFHWRPTALSCSFRLDQSISLLYLETLYSMREVNEEREQNEMGAQQRRT